MSIKGKSWAGDQTPKHVFFIEEIRQIFPDAKFINMIRDPRAVIWSQKTKWKVSKGMHRPLLEVLRTRFNYHPITQSLFWNKSVDAGLRFQRKLGDAVVRTVQFERLVTNPDLEVKEVCHFLSVKYSKKMLDVAPSASSNVASRKRRGVNSSIAGKWQSLLSPTEMYLVELLCGRRAKKLGYGFSNNIEPSFLHLILYLFSWPLHILVAVLFNLQRIGNPVRYFRKRFQP